MTLPDAFYRPGPEPGRWLSTELTRGPWSVEHQHGGPPSALLARAMEREGVDASAWRVARVTVELMRPVPIGLLGVEVAALRRGRKAEWLEATLTSDAGQVLARATCLRVRRAEVVLPPAKDPPAPALPAPEALVPFEFSFFRSDVAYHRAVEVRIARGRWGHEPTAAWLRSRVPLVAGEPDTPLVRTMVTADAVNGIAMVLDVSRFVFINPDLTVALWRDPQGEWVGFDTHATADAGGGGLCHATLHDVGGPVGHSLQSLILEMR